MTLLLLPRGTVSFTVPGPNPPPTGEPGRRDATHWRFVAADAQTGIAIGEIIQAHSRSVYLAVTRVDTASFGVRLDHALADRFLAEDILVKAYRNRVLKFVGEIVTAEEVADAQGASVAVTCAGPLWGLNTGNDSGRLIGKSPAGYAAPAADLSAQVAAILAAVNGDGYTGLDIGVVTPTGTVIPVTADPYANALNVINQIAHGVDGPEYRVVPLEPSLVAGGLRIGRLDVGPAFGQIRPAAAFEFGVGRRNVASYSRRVSKASLLNRGYGLAPATGGVVVTSSDAPSIARRRLFEGVVQADLSVDALRQQLVDENIRLRRAPQQTISFTPTIDSPDGGYVPQLDRDFDIGDAVPFRAVREDGQVRVNASLRAYAAQFTIADDGDESVAFTLTAS